MAGNTLNITVNDEFLAFARRADIGWLVGTTLTLDVEAETAMNTFVIIGFGGTAAAVIAGTIGILFFAIQIKRKKKDYAIALERHREAGKRMGAAAAIGDVVRQAKEGGEA
jgi:shikimate 5-dehydrogenase